jgi:AcrR family transcriptional regulator
MSERFFINSHTRTLINRFTEPFSYLDHLNLQLKNRNHPKKERTRYQLHAAVLKLADRENLEDILIDKIVQEAGVSRGTFYQYYPKVIDLLLDAIQDFFMTIWANRPPNSLFLDAVSYIYVTRLYSARTFEATPRAFFWYWYLSRRNTDLVAQRSDMAAQSTDLMISLLDQEAVIDTDPALLRAELRSAALMWNEMQVSYFIENDPILHHSIPDVLALTELSVIAWYRMIYSEQPCASKTKISIDEDFALDLLRSQKAKDHP